MSTVFSVTYNGTTISTAQSIFTINRMEGVDGLPIRISEDNLTSLDGGNIWARLYGMRTIAFEGTILTTNNTDYFTAKSTLVNMFSRFANSTLSITRWDGVVKTIQAKVVLQPMIVEIMGETNFCNWRVELKCEDPFFSGQNSTSYTLTLATGGGIPIPTPVPLPIQAGVGDTVVVANGGDSEAYGEFVITGPVVNPTLTNITTGKFFQINTTILEGQYVRVKFNQDGLYVKLNDSTTYYQYFLGTFWKFAVGNNTIRYSASSYNTTTNTVITFTNKFINL